MKKLWKRMKKKWSRAVDRFISDEEGVGVVEIILIYWSKTPLPKTRVYCVDTVYREHKKGSF